MLLDKGQMETLKSDLAVARHSELNFGICLGKKPETSVLLTDRKKDGDLLAKTARKMGETGRVYCGTIRWEGRDMFFDVADGDVPPGSFAKKVKAFLASAGVKANVLVLQNGESVPMEGDKDAAGAGEVKNANVVRDVAAPVAPAAETEDEDPLKLKWLKKKALVEKALILVLKQGRGDPSKLREAWALAIERAGDGNFKGAIAVADKLAKVIRGLPNQASDSAEKPAPNADAASEAPPNVVPFVKARMGWIEAREKLTAEMQRLKEEILAAAADDEQEVGAVQPIVDEIFKPLELLDSKLEDKLEQLIEAPEGPSRSRIKTETVAVIKTYVSHLANAFFAEIDANPFAPVAVTSTAKTSLTQVAKTLRA